MNRTTTIFVAFLMAGAALPVLTADAVYRQEGTVLRGVAGRRIILEKPDSRYDRQDLNCALKVYQSMLQQGASDIVKPDINEPATIKVYLDAEPGCEVRVEGDPDRAEPIAPVDWDAPEATESSREQADAKRALLRRSELTGTCWKSMNTVSPGLYELCLTLIEGKPSRRTRGLVNPYSGEAKVRMQPK